MAMHQMIDVSEYATGYPQEETRVIRRHIVQIAIATEQLNGSELNHLAQAVTHFLPNFGPMRPALPCDPAENRDFILFFLKMILYEKRPFEDTMLDLKAIHNTVLRLRAAKR